MKRYCRSKVKCDSQSQVIDWPANPKDNYPFNFQPINTLNNLTNENRLKAYKAIRLLGPSAASGTEEMATLSGLRPKAASLMALRAAVDFREFLTISGSLAPAAFFAGLVAGRAVSFGLLEFVDVQIFGVLSRDDLLPFDGLDVA